MCMRNTSEGCILSEQQSALKKEVLSLDERMDKLEKDFATMRSETQDGFRQGAAPGRRRTPKPGEVETAGFMENTKTKRELENEDDNR